MWKRPTPPSSCPYDNDKIWMCLLKDFCASIKTTFPIPPKKEWNILMQLVQCKCNKVAHIPEKGRNIYNLWSWHSYWPTGNDDPFSKHMFHTHYNDVLYRVWWSGTCHNT